MTASTTTQTFMPQTNISSLIYGTYKGFPLPKGKGYRPSNLDKVNSILGLAMEKKQSLYSFEIYEDALHSHFGNHLDAFDVDALFLRVGLKEHVRLVILTTKTQEEVTAFVNKYYEDFALKLEIQDVTESPIASASELYEFAEHFMVAKQAKKARQMSGNWLTADEKQVSVEFALTPTVRRS